MVATSSARDDGSPGASSLTEETLHLGASGEVVGILSRPPSPKPGLPAVMFLKAGVIHRVGPHRLHVTLARHLAVRGFTGLRLDLSGIGDSPLPGAVPFREQAVVDVRAAMDSLGELAGVRRFVLFGLCSGADNGLSTALADERVVGLVLIDSFTYVTLRSSVRKLVTRAQKLGTPRRFAEWGARLVVRRLRARVAAALGNDMSAPEQSGREPPPAKVFGLQLETLLARGVRLLACCSGALEERYNHKDQLFELLPGLRGRVDLSYYPEANHLFTERLARRRLISDVTDWLERHYA